MAKASNGTPRESEDYFMLANGRRLRVLKPGKRSEGLALGPAGERSPPQADEAEAVARTNGQPCTRRTTPSTP
jgi:hypothetical protein